MLSRKRLLLLLSAAAALIVTALHSTSQEPATPSRPAMRGAGGGVLVARVIDGDTIQLAGGELVRYIGVDAPETRRRVGDRWIQDAEPFGHAATKANRKLVESRRVRLEYDVQRRDRYGRLLAYVFVGDVMVNAKLLEEGYAQLLTIPPNLKYVELFRRLAQEARAHRRGLWRDLEISEDQR